jgi:ATP-dependent RNA helicase DeaD
VKVERSKHVVLVTPPAVERAGEVWPLVGPHTVVVCADHEQAAQWAAAAPTELRAHAITGLTRSAALLKEGRVGLVAGAAADLAALVARSALKLDAIDTVVLAWPETFSDTLDGLLAELPEARRIVLAWDPGALRDFIERHAYRAEIVGTLPVDEAGNALRPVCSARYAVVPASRRAAAVRETLDTLRAARPYVWNGGPVAPPEGKVDAVVCVALPAREQLSALAEVGPPVVLITSSQLPYLKSVAALKPLTLPPGTDRAQDRVAALRARIADQLERGNVDAELVLLEPLFERWDPAEVAAALLALSHQPSAVSTELPEPPAPGDTWVKLFLTVGRKDRVAPKDLVGALIKEVGLEKGQLGRIEVKETFSLVEVAPAVAEQAMRRLGGISIRGRRVSARMDRDA